MKNIYNRVILTNSVNIYSDSITTVARFKNIYETIADIAAVAFKPVRLEL